ncbi:D(2) dopamine receptor A-like [Saccoglossus kowalevskii]
MDVLAPPDTLHWWSLTLLVLIIWTMMGNVLVFLAILIDKKLQNPTNQLLQSLAVADFMVGFIVMPIGMINLLYGDWPFDNYVCIFWITTDVFMCASSIYHLTVISVDRYFAIGYPFKFNLFGRSRLCMAAKIGVSWLGSSVYAAAIFGLAIKDISNLNVNGNCVLKNKHFMLITALFNFVLPLSVMTICHMLTMKNLRKQIETHNIYASGQENNCFEMSEMQKTTKQNKRSFRMQNKEGADEKTDYNQSKIDHTEMQSPIHVFEEGESGEKDDKNSKPEETIKMNYGSEESASYMTEKMFAAVSTQLQMKRDEQGDVNDSAAGNIGRNNGIKLLQAIDSYETSPKEKRLLLKKTPKMQMPEEMTTDPPFTDSNHMTGNQHNTMNSVDQQYLRNNVTNEQLKTNQNQVDKNNTIVHVNMSNRNKGSIQLSSYIITTVKGTQNEQKAARVLSLVFLSFIIAWTPYFILLLINYFINTDEISIFKTLYIVFTWLGYFSSSINPIIYTTFNKQFRKTFNRLMICSSSNESPRHG